MQVSNTSSASETKKIAVGLVKKLLKKKSSIIMALVGELGSGKTTFIKGLAKGLKIKEEILSPTFILIRRHKINFEDKKYFYHIDAYRLEGPEQLLKLGFKEIINNSENIVVIEWADKIKKIVPKNAIWVYLKNLGGNKRELVFID